MRFDISCGVLSGSKETVSAFCLLFLFLCLCENKVGINSASHPRLYDQVSDFSLPPFGPKAVTAPLTSKSVNNFF